MAIKRVKKQDHENLSDANVAKVIDLLARKEKPITKKDACEILNISYNTTRLGTIMENYKIRKENEKKHRDANRGKPASRDEIKSIITQYLIESLPVSEIASNLYRSATFVKGVLDRYGVPEKATGDDKFIPGILPDECVAEEFKPGQIVWSAKHHSPCEVLEEVRNTDTVNYEEKYGCKCYKIYVFEAIEQPSEYFPRVEKGGFTAYVPAYDLGSLEHLKDYNVKLTI